MRIEAINYWGIEMKNLLEPKVHIFIENRGKFLFLKRYNTGCYDGYWCLPTGRIEKGECPQAAAKREVLEEVGLQIDPLFVSTIYAKIPNVISKTSLDYEDLCFFFRAKSTDVPRNCEPEKHDQLGWFDLADLPKPIMPVVIFGIECFLQRKAYGQFGYPLP